MSAAKLVAPDPFQGLLLPGAQDAARYHASLTALLARTGAREVSGLLSSPAPQSIESRTDNATGLGPNFDIASARFGVALSGGPDSVALLLLAAAATPGQVEAATVDHRLRPEARAEALWCADLCAKLDIPHSILTVERAIEGNIQSGARAARYALLQEWRAARGLDWLLTAHHADDQAETLLMRLNRGAGVSGLAGVRARNGTVLRPLLGWRRAELQAILDQVCLVACDDPSNRNRSYDRVRMRQAIAASDWIDVTSLSHASHHLSDAEAALSWTARQLENKYVVRDARDDGAAILLGAPLADLPRELARRLLARALAAADPAIAPRGDALDRLLENMVARQKAMIGDLLVTPETPAPRWRIRPAPPRASAKDAR